MNESSQNIRTLIVSFVFAIMVLIPLRFVEVGQGIADSPQVLGDEVVLPSAEVNPVLEAPYNEIENSQLNCIKQTDAEVMIGEGKSMIEGGSLSQEEVDKITADMTQVEANICK